jgi:NAD(P)H-hydrate epimerase
MGHPPPFTLTRAQVRELDRRAIEEYGIPGIVLMENAGRSCAELLMKLNPTKKPTVILCGPGNNGGDGFVMARHLDNAGWPVSVLCVDQPKQVVSPDIPDEWAREIRTFVPLRSMSRDAKTNAEIAAKCQFPCALICQAGLFQEWVDRFIDIEDRRSFWIVDALFGTGLSRPLGTPYSELVVAMNASGNPILAIDIPSGLDCDTGEPLGPTIRATHTATFVAPKRGFLNPKSREWTGEVHVIDIGAPRKLVEEYKVL